MHHAEVVDVDPKRQLLLVRQEAGIDGAKLLHQASVKSNAIISELTAYTNTNTNSEPNSAQLT
jgi:hypothetical protein